MKNWQASCDDGWESKTVEADDKMGAAGMLWKDLEGHVKSAHSDMEWPDDEDAKVKATVDHVKEVN